MSKRISPESIAVHYFESAPIDTARAVLSICTAKVKERVKAAEPPAPARAKRRAKPNGTHASADRATSFPGSNVEATA